MRVLVTGYSPRTHSSYGTIIKELWTRLLKSGEFQIEQHAWFDIPAMPDVTWNLWPTDMGVNQYGQFGHKEEDKWGEHSFEKVLRTFKPDIVWNLGDVYMSRYIDEYKKRYRFKLIRWTLTEGEPVDRDNIPSIQFADKTIAITNYSAAKWKEITGEDYQVIHHGVDTEIFKPLSHEERGKLREQASGGVISNEDFVMCFVGRNQGRKRPWIPFQILHYLNKGAWGYDRDNNPIVLEWDPVARKHKDNKNIVKYAKPIETKLWVHSGDDGKRWRYDLLEMQWDVALKVFRTTDLSDMKGTPTKEMANIYQLSDANSSLSGSEGFCVPIIEATSCGIPTVYTNYAGTGEVGRICSGKPVPYIAAEPAPVTHVNWVYPDLAKGVKAFHDIATLGHEYWDAKKDAYHEIAVKNFSHEKITEQWLNVLREVNEKPLPEIIGVRI